MAVTVITDACISGAMGALLQGRFSGSITPANYAGLANAAAAIGAEFATQNALLSVPMTDADNAQIGLLVTAVAYGCIAGGGYVSVTATDYLPIASQIAAAAKQTVAKLS